MNYMQTATPEQRAAIVKKAQATRRKNREEQDALRRDAITYAGGLKEQIVQLERKLANLKTMEVMAAVSAGLTGKALLPPEDIARAAMPWRNACGVYFLLIGDEVVYVGQSVNIYSRLSSHHIRNFDRFAFVLCDSAMLDRLESLYIHCLRPRFNGGKGAKVAPIPLDTLIRGPNASIKRTPRSNND